MIARQRRYGTQGQQRVQRASSLFVYRVLKGLAVEANDPVLSAHPLIANVQYVGSKVPAYFLNVGRSSFFSILQP